MYCAVIARGSILRMFSKHANAKSVCASGGFLNASTISGNVGKQNTWHLHQQKNVSLHINYHKKKDFKIF